MKTRISKLIFVLLTILINSTFSNAQKKQSYSTKPLQVFVSVGQNALNLDNINRIITNQNYANYRSLAYTLGGGLQKELFKDVILDAELYIGRSLNNKTSFVQVNG